MGKDKCLVVYPRPNIEDYYNNYLLQGYMCCTSTEDK